MNKKLLKEKVQWCRGKFVFMFYLDLEKVCVHTSKNLGMYLNGKDKNLDKVKNYILNDLIKIVEKYASQGINEYRKLASSMIVHLYGKSNCNPIKILVDELSSDGNSDVSTNQVSVLLGRGMYADDKAIFYEQLTKIVLEEVEDFFKIIHINNNNSFFLNKPSVCRKCCIVYIPDYFRELVVSCVESFLCEQTKLNGAWHKAKNICGNVNCCDSYDEKGCRKKYFKCGRCLKASYCSRECQKADWLFHKMKCEKVIS